MAFYYSEFLVFSSVFLLVFFIVFLWYFLLFIDFDLCFFILQKHDNKYGTLKLT